MHLQWTKLTLIGETLETVFVNNGSSVVNHSHVYHFVQKRFLFFYFRQPRNLSKSHGAAEGDNYQPSQKVTTNNNTSNCELAYYETKIKQQPITARNLNLSSTHREDNSQSPLQVQKCTSELDTHCCNELYAEQTTPARTSRTNPLNRRTECCCCCEQRKCRRSRQEKYNNVLHYLRDSQLADRLVMIESTSSLLSQNFWNFSIDLMILCICNSRQ